jgi:hypothetical protein
VPSRPVACSNNENSSKACGECGVGAAEVAPSKNCDLRRIEDPEKKFARLVKGISEPSTDIFSFEFFLIFRIPSSSVQQVQFCAEKN